MRTDIPRIALALAATLLAGGALADHAASDQPCSKFVMAAGRSPDLQVVNGRGELRAVKRGSRVNVELNGERVPASRLERRGAILEVRDEQGEIAFMIGVFGGFGRDGQLAYTPDLDPWSLRNRYGFTTTRASNDLREHLGLRHGEALGVGEVCAGSPAASVGLSERDLIVGLGGRRVGSAALERAAGAAAGERLLLDVVRAGSEHEVELAAAPVGTWPSAAELESYLRMVVHE
jgi:hypothetical protein